MKNESVRGLSFLPFLHGEIARDVFLLAGLASMARLIIHFVYEPMWAGDSPSYWNYLYDFARTPLYPFFLRFCGYLHAPSTIADRISCSSARTAVLCQHLCGIALCCMLYKTLRNLKVGRWFSLGGAGIFGTWLALAVFERYLLPLSLTLFLLGTSTWLFSEGLVSGRRSFLIASGVSFSITTLTRPEIVIFLFFFVLSYALASIVCGKRSSLKSQLVPFLAGALPLIVAWMLFFRITLGYVGITILAGLNHSAAAYNMFHLVEEKDAALGRIMLKYYRGPTRKDMICDAWPELMEHRAELPVIYLTDHNPAADLSRYVGNVSLGLLIRHPRIWLANAKDSWQHTYIFDASFGTPPLEHVSDPETPDHKSVVKSATLYRCVTPIRNIQAWPMVLAYWLSAGYVGLFVFWLRRPRTIETASVFVLAVACAAFGTLAAFCFLGAFFPHYGIPYWSSWVLCAVYLLHCIAVFLHRRRKADSRPGISSRAGDRMRVLRKPAVGFNLRARVR